MAALELLVVYWSKRCDSPTLNLGCGGL